MRAPRSRCLPARRTATCAVLRRASSSREDASDWQGSGLALRLLHYQRTRIAEKNSVGNSMRADRSSILLGRGIAFLFSDMLGRHTLSTTAQFGGQVSSLNDFAGQVGYLNEESQWAWGISAEKVW